MKLLDTTISATTVRMRFADNPDPTKATEWFEFAIPLAPLKIDENNLLGDPRKRSLAATQRAAIHHMQLALNDADDEIAASRR